MTAPLAHDVRIAAEVAAQIEAAGITADDLDYGKLLDGECDLNDRLRRMWRAARYARSQADAVVRLRAELDDTEARHLKRADEIERMLLWALQESGQKKLEAPDFVLSVIQGRGKVLVEGPPEALPDDLVTVEHIPAQTIRKPNKDAIREALAAKREVPGASIDNAAPYLQARKR